jgi:hypothetical protein
LDRAHASRGSFPAATPGDPSEREAAVSTVADRCKATLWHRKANFCPEIASFRLPPALRDGNHESYIPILDIKRHE